MEKKFFQIFILWFIKTGIYILLLTILLSCQSLLITYSKQNKIYKYNTTSTILLSEIIKIIISSIILLSNGQEIGFRINKETILYIFPALIYFIQNNLVFWALFYIDPTTYQILVNLKILTTGILFRFVLGKELSSMQWSGLILLMVGCATSQLSMDCKKENIFAIPIQGFLITILLSILSASAGITTEWIMKKSSLKHEPLQRQNIHLYFFGILFNIFGYFNEKKPGENFFDGYDFITILIVISYSFSGLCVSFIMKYADNMVKIYAVSVSMILTMIISIFLFDYEPTIQLFFGIIIITISILMYFNVISNETYIIKEEEEKKKEMEQKLSNYSNNSINQHTTIEIKEG